MYRQFNRNDLAVIKKIIIIILIAIAVVVAVVVNIVIITLARKVSAQYNDQGSCKSITECNVSFHTLIRVLTFVIIKLSASYAFRYNSRNGFSGIRST